MGGYARLADAGIDMMEYEAREALSNGPGRVIEHDVHPDDGQPCSTSWHKGEAWAKRPPVMFEVPNGGKPVFVCRYCLFVLAHTRQTQDYALEAALVRTARPHMEPLSMLIDKDGHLTSSASAAELHWFAGLVGLSPRWFQNGKHAHYDVTREGLRNRAVKLGARVVNAGRVAEASRELAKREELEDGPA